VRILVTGGSGVLGRSLLPLLAAAGHDVRAPARDELDLFDRGRVAEAVQGTDAIYHLATRIPPRERRGEPGIWRENDRLRAEASRLLVDAALAGETRIYVQPSVTFLYQPDGEVWPHLESALTAEREAIRFAETRVGVVLRLGTLDGPGTDPDRGAEATIHVDDAGRALLAALEAPSGVYNIVRDGERVSNVRFKQATGWRPRL
jgi:nucleoside-diphosphate-sugar epimerase